ncbi:hypothetical protein [uncultured Desulfobacter sp.]|uniref:hypothetical protein n=1 Tax=uncultured Desulfobacter sp. TaxID=240139 RepID=UPI0029F4F602|nr:hypothetical protein [uncultured Desulfobacter sp.]
MSINRSGRGRYNKVMMYPQVRESARFFANAAIEAAKGRKPMDSLEMVQKELSSNSVIYQMITDGLESIDTDTEQAIAGFGQMCETQAALPGTGNPECIYSGNMQRDGRHPKTMDGRHAIG